MSVRGEWTVGNALGAFDEHLRRARGLCSGTRRNYARYTGEFLWTVFPAGRVDVNQMQVGHVIAFVAAATPPLSAQDGGVIGDVTAVVLPVCARSGVARGQVGGLGADGAAPAVRSPSAS